MMTQSGGMMDCKQLRHELALAAGGDEDSAHPPAIAGIPDEISAAGLEHLSACHECREFLNQLQEGMLVLRSVASELAPGEVSAVSPEDGKGYTMPTTVQPPMTLQSLANHLPERSSPMLAQKSWAEMKAAATRTHRSADHLSTGHRSTSPPASSRSSGLGKSLSGQNSAGWYPTVATLAAGVLVGALVANPQWSAMQMSGSNDFVATRNLFNDPEFQRTARTMDSARVHTVSMPGNTIEITPPVLPMFTHENGLDSSGRPLDNEGLRPLPRLQQE